MPRKKGSLTSYERLLAASTKYPLVIGEGVDRISKPRDAVYSIALTNNGRNALVGLASTGIGELQRHEWELQQTGENEGEIDAEIQADIDSREAYFEVLNLTTIHDVIGIIVRHIQLTNDVEITFPSCEVDQRVLVSFARSAYPDCDIPNTWDDNDFVLVITDFVGQKGDTGEQGPPGTDGSDGSNGAKGDKGDKGDTGECPDCKTGEPPIIDPPPPGSRPPGMPPTDTPPTDPPPPDTGGRVDLACEDNPIYSNSGTNHTGGVDKLTVSGNPIPVTIPLLIANIQLDEDVDIFSLVNIAIANSGMLPSGKVVSNVKLGYSYICTGGIEAKGAFLVIDNIPLFGVKSVLPFLKGVYNGSNIGNLPMPPDKFYRMFHYATKVANYFKAEIEWYITEATETQTLWIDDWQGWSALTVNAAMMPALPIPFNDGVSSPILNICLLGFDYDDATAQDPCFAITPFSKMGTALADERSCWSNANQGSTSRLKAQEVAGGMRRAILFPTAGPKPTSVHVEGQLVVRNGGSYNDIFLTVEYFNGGLFSTGYAIIAGHDPANYPIYDQIGTFDLSLTRSLENMPEDTTYLKVVWYVFGGAGNPDMDLFIDKVEVS